MRFVVGCDLEEFKKYSRRDGARADLAVLEKVLPTNPSSLLVWKENNEIVGHAIWHETNTQEHRKGDPRDKEDTEVLEKLLGGKKSFVELHEIWLIEEHRGKGHGKRFFDFFEEFLKNKGYDSIVYYANHPAAIAICRQRGCKEGYLTREAEYVFYRSLKKKT
jgi:GNAT superfamily N-acetyltransferase